MKKYSVIVRVEYTIELEAEDPESAEEEARELYHKGLHRRFQMAEIDSVQADEMG